MAASAGRLWKFQQNPAATEDGPLRLHQATACLSDGRAAVAPRGRGRPPLQTAEMGAQPNGVLLRGTSLGIQPPGSSETGCAWEFSAGGQGKGPRLASRGLLPRQIGVRLTGTLGQREHPSLSASCFSRAWRSDGRCRRGWRPALLRPS